MRYRVSMLLAVALWALTLSGQAKGPNDNSTETARGRARVHGQLWKNTERLDGTIAEELATRTGVITIIDEEDRVENDYAHQILPPYPPMRMVEFACMSDAVVTGRAESGERHMTADLSFIYSEWKFRITRVLQDNPKSSLVGKKELQVVRAGGALGTGGRVVIGKELGFPIFELGDEYLLYLKYIPETGFYKVIAGRSFDLSHGSVADAPYMGRSWDKVPVDEVLRDTKAAISAAKNAVYCAKAANR
jgi:hypothetical protein